MNEIERYTQIDRIEELAKCNDAAIKRLKELVISDKESFVEEYEEQFSIVSRMVSEISEIANTKLSLYNKVHTLGKDGYNAINNIKEKTYKELAIGIKREDKCKIVIDCPGVDLHRKRINSQPFFLGILKWLLCEYQNEQDFIEWKHSYQEDKMTIHFIHEYASVDKCVDNDNLDCKAIIDTLDTLGYIRSDRGDMLCHIHSGKITDRFHTKIILCPSSKVQINM